MAEDRTPKLYQELEASLQIDEHALNEAIEEQPNLFYRISRELALLESQRDAAKQALMDEEAKVDTRLRFLARKSETARKQDKLTEGEIKAQTRLNPDVGRALQVYLALSQQVGLYEALKESYKQRSYALGHLVELYIAGYYGQAKQNRSSGSMREHRYTEGRAALNRVRRESR